MPEVEEETEMDPVTAAGAAKGLMTTANSVTKNSLFQALFLPTAKAYGDHWGTHPIATAVWAGAVRRLRG